MLKPGKGINDDCIYSTCCFNVVELQNLVGFLHAMSGCDTTSALFNQGKNKLISLLANDKEMKMLAANFYRSDVTATNIGQSGVKIITGLYSAKKDTDLGELRFLHFKKASFKTSIKLEKLPPTEGSAVQHSLRVYHQLQTWIGKKIDPTKWGWKCIGQNLQPIYSTEPMMPEELSRTISCKCKKGCKTKACTCRKNGFKCTDMCGTCIDVKCSNVEEASEIEESMFDDDMIMNDIDDERILENNDETYENYEDNDSDDDSEDDSEDGSENDCENDSENDSVDRSENENECVKRRRLE